MGIFDFLTGEFIDVIHWTDDTRDTMVWRFQREGHAISLKRDHRALGHSVCKRQIHLETIERHNRNRAARGPGRSQNVTQKRALILMHIATHREIGLHGCHADALQRGIVKLCGFSKLNVIMEEKFIGIAHRPP